MEDIPNKKMKHVKILTVLAIATSLSLGVYMYKGKNVTISIDDNEKEVRTYKKTVGELLKAEDIQLDEGATINFAPSEKLENDMNIIIKTPKPYIVYMGKVKAEINSVYTKVSDILNDIEIELGEKDKVAPGLDKELQPNDKIEITKVEEKFEELEEKIPFEEVTRKNKDLDEGTTKVVQEGKEGIKKIRIRKIFENGKMTLEEKISEAITRNPVPKLIDKGTKVKVKKKPQNNLVASSRGSKLNSKKTFVVTATAYDLSYESCGKKPGDKGYGITASGMKAKYGIVAVDPKVIPLGTKLYIESLDKNIPDYGYAIAGDTGGAIKGNKIDLFFPTKEGVNNFGKRKVRVHILN